MRIPAVVTVGMLMRRKMDLNYPRRLKSIKGLRRVKEGGRERQRERHRERQRDRDLVLTTYKIYKGKLKTH